ncbi:sigma-54-dependent transcriptional regulator [Halomonas sp. AOP12-C2-37]|uniref:Sigma-54-dependent Fis family transcriptional regulator n=1 Tax=Halomonas casei TaxID=2742613 RepID=A0ABR9F016_9GAMM|nr:MULTISPECIES: sigma-54 dependent transcriptional regulator [Halomonas]MBE0399809.1 sigma-54-dependent Fis family transcriptional regulator [Halomonas casei]PCC23631.1 sigma-54-dependent Fis family transcriptional regulator [Halomonas sp. JB37]
MPEVMLVEDDEDLRQATTETLERAGFQVHGYMAAQEALNELTADFPGVILSDMRMPGLSGLDFLDCVRELAPEVPFILITAHGDVPAAMRAMRNGAHDFLEKPCSPELMLDVLKRAQAMRDLYLENERLRQTGIEDRLIGGSAIIRQLREKLRRLACLDVDLLIAGETGTGKELVARVLHHLSARGASPFVAINCGALSEADVDRELFGTSDSPGLIARAQGGVLYLDELESMPDNLQVRLLRVVDTREITPLGAAPRSVDLRILGSVKHPTEQLVAEGRLRADLLHRFNAGTLFLPSLREREDDALLLVNHFVVEAAARHNLPKMHIDSALSRRIAYYDWPGNVREARNLAERLVIGLDTSLCMTSYAGKGKGQGYDAAMEEFEARLLRSTLLQSGGRKAEAAALLDIPRKRLYLRLRHHDLL